MAACRACGKESEGDARFCAACGAPLGEPVPTRRKLVTVLDCDVSGSTAAGERLDAETVRELMLRYFHTMRSALERHGGTVEKFIGDAVFAAFGVPVAHDDDALRACRAAVEMRERLAALNGELERRFGATLAVRIGVCTGELVAGDAAGREAFVFGDAANTAARLQAAAQPGEILVGELTWRLAGPAVEVEPGRPIRAKGKAEPVSAYRLVGVVPGPAQPRPALTPLLGRDEHVAHLEALLEQALAERRCLCATIAGEPGVGKSRLAAELSARLAGRATSYTGHCLAYGEGITYWPLAEIVRLAAQIHDEDTPAHARAKLDRLVEASFAEAVATAIGLSDRAAETGEIAWAFRRLFAALAVERPLLLLVEDVHWAEQTLLDLLVRLAERAQAPILLLCTARPELLEARPDWPVTVRLQPLAEGDAERLVDGLPPLPQESRSRVLAAARGNPLFLEELHAYLREHPDETEIPPSLSAVLSARLDRLPEPERAAAERAAVEGELFHRGAVAFLSDEPEHVPASLAGLHARELIQPAQALYRDEAAYRFKHVLVRDAAYNGAAKTTRARLHERYADWLERAAGDRMSDAEEILGHHLEQAYRYRTELAPPDEHAVDLARRAGERLALSGTRASRRGDIRAAVNLLARARSLLPPGHPERAAVLFELGRSLRPAGERARSDETLAEAIETARAAGDRALEWRARLAQMRGVGGPRKREAWSEVRATIERALPELEALGDEALLAQAWVKLGLSRLALGRRGEAEETFERALAHAERSGDEQQAGGALVFLAGSLIDGPRPLDDVLPRLEPLRARTAERRSLQGPALAQLALAHSLAGRAEEARGLIARSIAIREELGHRAHLATVRFVLGDVERAAGDRAAAERAYRESVERLSALGDEDLLPGVMCSLAELLIERGALAEAEELLRQSDQLASVDDPDRLCVWLRARAMLLARRGRLADALARAREATALADTSDDLVLQGRARLALADVLHAAGRSSEAAAELEEAARLFHAKGAVAFLRQAEATLAGMSEDATSVRLGG